MASASDHAATRPAWAPVPLRELLRPVSEPHRVEAARDYPNLGIYSFGRGLFRKAPILGAATSARTLFRVRRGQFIYSRLFAFEGAYALVSDDFDGAFVSNEFPTFEPDAARILPTYLAWYFRIPSVWEEVAMTAVGMGDRRRRVQPGQLLRQEVPLPPLPEQRRIVAKLDACSTMLGQVTRLRQSAAEETRRLATNMAHRQDLDDAERERHGWRVVRLSEVIRLVKDRHRVEVGKRYENLGIYSFGRGLFHKPPIEGALTSAPFLQRVRRGQFIYSRLFAFEGAYGMVTDEFDGFFVSQEYPTFECQQDTVRVEFLWAYFSSSRVWKEVATGSKGLGDRRQRVQPAQVLNRTIWLPPMSWQARLVETIVHARRLERQHKAARAELDVLLPAILGRAFSGEL